MPREPKETRSEETARFSSAQSSSVTKTQMDYGSSLKGWLEVRFDYTWFLGKIFKQYISESKIWRESRAVCIAEWRIGFPVWDHQQPQNKCDINHYFPRLEVAYLKFA